MADDTHEAPPPFPAPLALLFVPALYEESRLKEWIEADDRLSAETPRVLLAHLVLRRDEPFCKIRSAFRGIMDMIKTAWSGGPRRELSDGFMPMPSVVLPEEDPDLEAFRTVDRRLAQIQAEARRAERIIEDAGYRWNRDGGHLETVTGKRPRHLLRDLVGVCVRGLGATRNTKKLREEIAAELSTVTFFPADMLDTSKGSRLHHAVRREIEARKSV